MGVPCFRVDSRKEMRLSWCPQVTPRAVDEDPAGEGRGTDDGSLVHSADMHRAKNQATWPLAVVG